MADQDELELAVSERVLRPARPLRPRARDEQHGKSLKVRYCNREWGAGIFMLLWLTGWTVGCVFLAGLVIGEPKLSNFLFAVPFWASWLFVFIMLLKMFFQREVFLLGPTGAVFSRRVLIEIARRETPIKEIRQFNTHVEVADSESGRTESSIEMKTIGLPLRFAAGLEQSELLWLQDVLTQKLAELHEQMHIELPKDDMEDDERFRPDPPSDCSWRREDDFDGPVFRQSGHFSLSTAGVLLFINAFWNGIVSVFVCNLCGVMNDAPQGKAWWGAFFFLIPFEGIGIAMFVALILVVLEPARRTSWTIGRSNIKCRLTWFGIGRTWNYPIDILDRIEVENKEATSSRGGKRLGLPWRPADATFRLSFVDRSNQEVCSLDGLTEGEARWIADIVRRERAVWF